MLYLLKIQILKIILTPVLNKKVLMIKQQKTTFNTSAVYSKENLKDITTNSYWEINHEKDRRQETNNLHIIARRHITKGCFTNANRINFNLVQSQLGYTIIQEELDL